MYISDIIMATSLMVIIVALFKEPWERDLLISLSLLIITCGNLAAEAMGMQPHLTTILFCMIFSMFVSLLQAFLADRILLTMTLSYDNSSEIKFNITKTPWFITWLWWIGITQLSYLWFRLDYSLISWSVRYSTFFVLGFIYFYTLEYIVGNYAHWWKRRNCLQPFGVAFYATIAGTLTVIILPFFLGSRISMPHVIIRGISAGFVIASIFVFCGYLGYRDSLLRWATRE